MDRRVLFGAAGILAVVVLAGLAVWLLQASQSTSSAPLEPVTVAYSPFESTALFWIAQDRHFFEENGINITLRKYDSGAASLDGVVNGEADIAVGTTEFPLVRMAFRNERVRTIGVIDRGYFTYLVARRDRGIANISDLKGKKVGTAVGTIAEFHLGRFLMLHGISIRDITLVDVRTPDGWVNAVADGEIDAISIAQPYANTAGERLGDNGITWSVQSGQPLFAMTVSSDGWISGHRGTAVKFMRSLAQADEYAIAHPSDARRIVQERLDLEPGYMDIVWQRNQFSLSLDQSLILAMEDEARWMIANNLTDANAVPDFRHYIYTDALESVKPGSVKIIG